MKIHGSIYFPTSPNNCEFYKFGHSLVWSDQKFCLH